MKGTGEFTINFDASNTPPVTSNDTAVHFLFMMRCSVVIEREEAESEASKAGARLVMIAQGERRR